MPTIFTWTKLRRPGSTCFFIDRVTGQTTWISQIPGAAIRRVIAMSPGSARTGNTWPVTYSGANDLVDDPYRF
jgi:hypothetical protein